MWVLDCVQERFHYTSSGGFEDTFIKIGYRKQRKLGNWVKERLKVEEVTGEGLGGVLLAP